MSFTYIVRISFDGDSKPIRCFEIPRESTVDSLYMALSAFLETTIQEAQSYNLTCLANDKTLEPSMGRQPLAELVKASRGHHVLEFKASKRPLISFSFVVGDITDSDSETSSEASSISYCSDDSDYTSSETTESTETTDTTEDENDEGVRVRKTARFYMNHDHDDYYDEIDLYREDDQIRVDYFYDRRSRSDTSACTNTFRGSIMETIEHMNHVFRMIAVDRKPYREIEVDIPFFPAMSQVPRDLLKKARRAMILVALKEFLEEGLN